MYLLQTLGAVALHPESGRDFDAEPLLRGSKTLVLAAYLAERPDRSASREHLAELFWPSVSSSQARRSLRQALYYLGRRHASISSDQQVPDSVQVAIGGRTVDTEIEHGPVRVWKGLRYVPE